MRLKKMLKTLGCLAWSQWLKSNQFL